MSEDRADGVGGDGDDDDLGSIKSCGRLLGAKDGHTRRQWDTESRVRVAVIECRDNRRVTLRAPEAKLMFAGMERGKECRAHIARAEDRHTRHGYPCGHPVVTPYHPITLTPDNPRLRIDPKPCLGYYSRRK